MPSRALLDRLAAADLVVAFTGAGISAESGIPTFRDKEAGLWSKFDPNLLATPQAFLASPQFVWSWYQSRRKLMLAAEPNPGHRALADLQALLPAVSVITQNIDSLHHRAGSREVIELHGNMLRNICQLCRKLHSDPALLTVVQVPRCACGGLIRPDVVWFGEMLPQDAFDLAESRAAHAAVFLSIGTSANVYPAAGLPEVAKAAGAYLVEINPEPTPHTPLAHESHRGLAGKFLPKLVAALRHQLDTRAPLVK